MQKYRIYVLEREKDNIENIIQSNEILKRHKDSFKIFSKDITSNLSSTYVRAKIKQGKSIRYLTASEVEEYILKNNLYS